MTKELWWDISQVIGIIYGIIFMLVLSGSHISDINFREDDAVYQVFGSIFLGLLFGTMFGLFSVIFWPPITILGIIAIISAGITNVYTKKAENKLKEKL